MMAPWLARLSLLAGRLESGVPAHCFADPERNARLCHQACGLLLDLRREWLDAEALTALLQFARERELEAAIAALFAGEPVNSSENRPALHMAWRGEGPEAAVAEATRGLAAMEAIASRASSDPGWFGLEEVRHVVHLGIGGSLSGPRLLMEFLGPSRDGRCVHYLSNADGLSLRALLSLVDAERTLLVIVSKSFATAETLANARVLISALAARRQVSEATVRRAVVAVTSRPERARAFGVGEEAILPLAETLGGRYSTCSPASFSVVLAHGAAVFRAILAGAGALDRHFRSCPLEENLPVLAALVDFWNRSVLRAHALCLLPYADRLAALVPFVQQLMMESNGKAVDREGRPLPEAAAPVVFGQVGCDAEHVLLQWLVQGRERVPVEFVAVPPKPGCPLDRLRTDHLIAQASRLADPPAEDSPHRRAAGPRPCRVLALLDERPETLGALIAFYEHRAFVQSVLWGNNAFDQWGVEAGKRLANQIALSRLGQADLPEDPWLRDWLRRWP